MVRGVSPRSCWALSCALMVLSGSATRPSCSAVITRTVHTGRPPAVEYALTDLARGATAALQHLQNWAEEHTSDYDHHRHTHPTP